MKFCIHFPYVSLKMSKLKKNRAKISSNFVFISGLFWSLDCFDKFLALFMRQDKYHSHDSDKYQDSVVVAWVVLWYRFSSYSFQGLTWKAFEKALENTCVTTNLKKEDSARTVLPCFQ